MTLRKDPASRSPWGGIPFEQRERDRRDRIVECAFEAFGTRGYIPVTVRQICKDLRMSPRQFYVLFNDKRDMFDAVCDRADAELHTAVKATGGVPKGGQRLHAAIRAYVEANMQDRRRIRVLAARGLDPTLDARLDEIRERWVSLFGLLWMDAVADGRTQHDSSVRTRVRMMLGALDMAAHLELGTPEGATTVALRVLAMPEGRAIRVVSA